MSNSMNEEDNNNHLLGMNTNNLLSNIPSQSTAMLVNALAASANIHLGPVPLPVVSAELLHQLTHPHVFNQYHNQSMHSNINQNGNNNGMLMSDHDHQLQDLHMLHQRFQHNEEGNNDMNHHLHRHSGDDEAEEDVILAGQLLADAKEDMHNNNHHFGNINMSDLEELQHQYQQQQQQQHQNEMMMNNFAHHHINHNLLNVPYMHIQHQHAYLPTNNGMDVSASSGNYNPNNLRINNQTGMINSVPSSSSGRVSKGSSRTPEQKARHAERERIRRSKLSEQRTSEQRAKHAERERVRRSKLPADRAAVERARHAERERLRRARIPDEVMKDLRAKRAERQRYRRSVVKQASIENQQIILVPPDTFAAHIPINPQDLLVDCDNMQQIMNSQL